MSEKNIAETVEELAAAGLRIQEVHGSPIAILPQGYCAHSLESHLPAPKRIMATNSFISLESFTRYVNQFKDDSTRVCVGSGGRAFAVIDANDKDDPAWESHKATFEVTYSDRWKTWDGQAKKVMTQKQFAEFVEDNLADFFSPKGTDMLDLARTLQIEQNSHFNSAIRLENGDVQLGYTKTTTAKAGVKDDLTIPSQFTIGIPVLENEPTRQIEVRLRYDLQDGKVTFTFEILRRTALLEEVRRSIYATIKNDTGIEPFLVA